MMTFYSYLIPPVVGAVIGYVTNAVAIRMIFRPYHSKMIGGIVHVPFTPGILPKQRYELSKNIAELVKKELLSPAVVCERLLAPEVQTALAKILMDNFSETFPLRFEGICNALSKKLLTYVSGKMPLILDTLDVSKIVSDRIDSLDMADIERMVMQVTRSQLRWINVFGGMLGALIGVIQVFLNMAV